MIVVHLKTKHVQIPDGKKAEFVGLDETGSGMVLRVMGDDHIYAEFPSEDVDGWTFSRRTKGKED